MHLQQKLQVSQKGYPHMNLTDLSVEQKCTKAYELIYAGQYEAAKEVLGRLWRGIGETPALDYPPEIAAEVLLVCGSLTGWLGSSKQIDAQEKAKDLLTQALNLFQSLGNREKVSEVQYELGICYWRLGAFDEARIVFNEALEGAREVGKVLITRTTVEISTGHYHEAWRMLDEARSSFDESNHALKGRWHAQMALVLRRLAQAENKIEYFDRAIVEYTAAIYHYEEAGHVRYCATNLNNIAFLLYKLGHYTEAHEHLDRAHKFLERLKDIGLLAQVDETRARVLLAEKKYKEARRVIIGVVDTLSRGGERALLADALTIKAIAQARLGDYEYSIMTFRFATEVAEKAGAKTNAAQAAISMIEEHRARLSEYELFNLYNRADKWLSDTQDAEHLARLRFCARIVTQKLFGKQFGDPLFSLQDVVAKYEARFIEEALQESKGKVTQAAKLLGITHQSLASKLRSRHKHLLKKRRPVHKRKRKRKQ
ncbi:MAG: hypothetical protein AUG51_23995 [Acidobacteria bacterium 13_1_20CM_3_53_8]|nr:MAG: hypothetical protein AUG51_23995 [Acidobacteria bacterium 13_1_20CM_3_53_8]